MTAALCQLIYPLLCARPLSYSTAVPLALLSNNITGAKNVGFFFFCLKLVLHKADFMFKGKTYILLLVFKLSCEKSPIEDEWKNVTTVRVASWKTWLQWGLKQDSVPCSELLCQGWLKG